MSSTVCYHYPCVDGWVSALSAWLVLGHEATFVAWPAGLSTLADLAAQNGPAFAAGRTVYFLDVCPPTAVLQELLERGCQVVVLDHHESSQRRIPELAQLKKSTGRLVSVIDGGMSGAMHAYAFFHPDDPPPALVRYVDDRDRWVWALPHSREISAVLDSFPIPAEADAAAFEQWKALALSLETPEGFVQHATAGAVLLRVQDQLVMRQLERAREGVVLGHAVPIVNLTVHHSQTLACLLAMHPEAPFVAGYFDDAGSRHWSLRTRPDRGTDVSLLAERAGGGGHTLAAGFEEPLPPCSQGPMTHDYEARSA